MTPPTRASVTSAPRHALQHVARNAGVPQAVREPPADEHRLRRRLEHDGVPRGQRREHAAGGDRQREVPRRRDDDHAERLHPAVLEPAGGLAQRPRVVAREVHGLGHLGVRLRHRLGAVEDHRADQVAAPPVQLCRTGFEDRIALGVRQRAPRGLRRARDVEGAIDIRGAGERVAVRDVSWT
jgi:hypothetical protein